MNTELLFEINERLNLLHKILSKIIPIEKIDLHPAEYFSLSYQEILNSIDKIIKNAEQKSEFLVLNCNEIYKEIESKCINLNLEIPEIPNLLNYNLKREFLLNELNRVNLYEMELTKEIDLWISKNTEINLEIYNLPYKTNKLINLEFLLNLKNEHKKLKEEKFKKELRRGEMTKKIRKYSKLLEISPVLSSKISELEETYNNLSKLYIERENLLSLLKIEISSKESLLNIHASSISNSLSLRNIQELKEYLIFLEDEYNRKIDEIYNTHLKKLRDLLNLFGMKEEIYKKDNEGLQEIQIRIEDLELKKDSFLEIINLIERRYSLLESMNEFEIIASDPKRLFKSSFQLNKEEKFRKNAFPSLLKIEGDILNKIYEYNQKYDKFLKDGKDFESEMKSEIDNRIINKTVFINKYDSPYKRK